MSEVHYVSEDISEAFEATDYSLLMLEFGAIYAKIVESMPQRNISFPELSLENVIGCEVVCAAICHQINWDFLRSAVYRMTLHDSSWLTPKELSKITSAKVMQLLSDYDKPERVRKKERSTLLRSLGKGLISIRYNYSDIFFAHDFSIKSNDEIVSVLNLSKAFSGDPEGKKTQLLLQNLSEYEELTALKMYCKPAIDYHIIRAFLRRGLVIPINQKAHDFIHNPDVQRKESTVAALRKVCAEVFETLQWVTSYDVTTINTIEWWIGRSVCIKESPDCELSKKSSQWLKKRFDRCPFYESCHAIKFDRRYTYVVEPNYRGSSY